MVMKKIWDLIKITGKWIWVFMKKVWLGTIGIALWLSACFIIYKQTDLLISDKIQALAIVTLIFVTIFYAIQTQRLVKQEKISLEEQKKKNHADFWERKLKEYFLPVRIALMDFIGLLSIKALPSDEIKKEVLKISDLFAKAIMMSKETMDSLNSLMDEFLNFKHLKEKGISEEKWIDDTRKKIMDLIKQNEVEIVMVEGKIREVYSFYIDEKMAKSLEDFRKGFGGHDEKRKKP